MYLISRAQLFNRETQEENAMKSEDAF